MREREDEWTDLMRSAISGDDAAYHRLLKAVTPVLRAAARRGLARAGQPVDQSEDIVQDILLAVHLKRHTWDAERPVRAMAVRDRPQQADRCAAPPGPPGVRQHRRLCRDAARRGGRRRRRPAGEVAAQLQTLPARQREVLQSIAVESASIKDTAAKFSMSEGAVRVALHRGLASLTAKLREQ